MTPYLLLVALSVGLPVSMGSEELSSLELLTKKIKMRTYTYTEKNVRYIFSQVSYFT